MRVAAGGVAGGSLSCASLKKVAFLLGATEVGGTGKAHHLLFLLGGLHPYNEVTSSLNMHMPRSCYRTF